jgi:hypothetical protein
MRHLPILLAVALLLPPTALAQEKKEVIRPGDSKLPLKQRHQFNHQGSQSYYGVVTEIDEDKLTIRCKELQTGKETETTLYAIDLLKAGEVQDWADSAHSYRWQDVKKGDTVHLWDKKDPTDGTRYVFEIAVYGRPGGKLPQSQKAKEDKSRWAKYSLLNDIDNGEDVNEDDILKTFPAFWTTDSQDRRLLIKPAGLPEEYRNKLFDNRAKIAAAREKKEAEVKAKPPEKKDDKK